MRSEAKSAWTSDLIGYADCPDQFCGLEGKRVYIRTNRGIFQRALVVKETREILTVRYVEKTDHRTGDPVTKTENIRRRDIQTIRAYRD